MRPQQIFAAMSPERAEAFFERLAGKSPEMFSQAVGAAAAAFKSRPQFLMKQPFARRAAAVRQALSRVGAGPVAEEMLAIYFLECRKELLVEWLDLVGLAHEEGTLKEDHPQPPSADRLTDHVKSFREKEADPDRELLLQAFAAQSAIDWPVLDDLLTAAKPR